MSKFQITILVLLGLIACGVLAAVGIVGFVFLSQPQEQANTQVSENSSLPEPTEEPAPEPTPTFTPPPTATPISGWKKFEGGDVELWLPPSYEGGNPSEDVGVVIERLRAMGPEFEQMVQAIEQNQSAYVIWAFDSELGGDGSFLTNVNVSWEQVVSGITPEIYMEAAARQLPAEFQVVERQAISLERYEAGQMFLEFTILGTSGKQVVYVIKDGNTIWNVTFSTGQDEFEQRLPNFEQSVQTFKVLR